MNDMETASEALRFPRGVRFALPDDVPRSARDALERSANAKITTGFVTKTCENVGEAIGYTLRHWDALCRYTEAGHLETSNNYAERCMRLVAVGRKAFLFVGSERAGHAAAIYYSIVESCKLNQVNPLTYLTHVLTHVRNRSVRLPTPDEFIASDITQLD